MPQEESGEFRATVTGILLGMRHPEEYTGEAVLEALRYDGTALGKCGPHHDWARITSALDVQVRDATQFVRDTTVRFAVFEGIVNGVLHRDYELETRKIRL